MAEVRRARNRQYQREYYQRNRERLLQSKRDRYRKDPQYREDMRIRDQQRYRLRRRQEGLRELLELEFDELEVRATVVLVDEAGYEHEVRLYDTESIARIVSRSVQTVRNWTSSGVLPPPTLRGWDLGIRGNPLLYREDEVRAIYDCRDYLRRPTQPLHESAFASRLRAAFAQLPVLEIRSEDASRRSS